MAIKNVFVIPALNPITQRYLVMGTDLGGGGVTEIINFNECSINTAILNTAQITIAPVYCWMGIFEPKDWSRITQDTWKETIGNVEFRGRIKHAIATDRRYFRYMNRPYAATKRRIINLNGTTVVRLTDTLAEVAQSCEQVIFPKIGIPAQNQKVFSDLVRIHLW